MRIRLVVAVWHEFHEAIAEPDDIELWQEPPVAPYVPALYAGDPDAGVAKLGQGQGLLLALHDEKAVAALEYLTQAAADEVESRDATFGLRA
jgi:hypothetical protein